MADSVLASEVSVDASSRKERLKKAYEAAEHQPESLTVRELMAWFDAGRRGYKVVDRMRRALRRAGLRTEPDFASAHIDSRVKLVRRLQEQSEAEAAASDEVSDVQLRVSSLAAAAAGVVAVGPDESIEVACTRMSLNDYSQLAVQAGPRSVKGFISWETIGRRRLTGEPALVRDATRPDVAFVNLDDPLLPVLARVATSNFVFVRAQDQTLAGIITAADVTLEFQSLASPYLLMGEIERRLRRFVDSVCQPAELVDGFTTSGEARKVESAEDLTLGELARLFEKPEVWKRLNWRLDRTYFVRRLHDVRRVRNELMHFAEEPPTSEDMDMLGAFARTLSGLHNP